MPHNSNETALFLSVQYLGLARWTETFTGKFDQKREASFLKTYFYVAFTIEWVPKNRRIPT